MPTPVTVVIHVPMSREIGSPATLSKIMNLAAVPRVGDIVMVIDRAGMPIDEVRFHADGATDAHVLHPNHLFDLCALDEEDPLPGLVELIMRLREGGWADGAHLA